MKYYYVWFEGVLDRDVDGLGLKGQAFFNSLLVHTSRRREAEAELQRQGAEAGFSVVKIEKAMVVDDDDLDGDDPDDARWSEFIALLYESRSKSVLHTYQLFPSQGEEDA